MLQAIVMAILTSTGFVDSSQGCEGPVGLVLDTTNFYAEQGGQVADIGSFASSSGHTFEVQDTQVPACWVLACLYLGGMCWPYRQSGACVWPADMRCLQHKLLQVCATCYGQYSHMHRVMMYV